MINLLQILKMLEEGVTLQDYEQLNKKNVYNTSDNFKEDEDGLHNKLIQEIEKNNPKRKCKSCVCEPKGTVNQYDPNDETTKYSDSEPMETLEEIKYPEYGGLYMKDGEKAFFDGGFLTHYEKFTSEQKHLTGEPWDVFDIYRLAMPYIHKEEIIVNALEDHISIEVILDESISEKEDRPFAEGGYQEIPVLVLSEVQAEFKNGYLMIIIKEIKKKPTSIDIL